MANTFTSFFNGSSALGGYVQVSYDVTTDEASFKTTIKNVKYRIVQNNSYSHAEDSPSFSITIGGVSFYSGSLNFSGAFDTGWKSATYSTITCNRTEYDFNNNTTNGTCNVTFAVYYGGAGSGSALGYVSRSETVLLSTLPVLAKMVSVSCPNDESSAVVTYSNPMSYSVNFYIAFNADNALGTSITSSCYKISAYSTGTSGNNKTITFTLGNQNVTGGTVLSKLLEASANMPSIKARFFVETVVGSNKKTPPSGFYADANVLIANANPVLSVGGVTLSSSNGNKYVLGHSNVTIGLTDFATTQKSATLTQVVVMPADSVLNRSEDYASTMSFVFNKSTYTSFDITVYDSRGNSSKTTVALPSNSVYTYVVPVIQSFEAVRASGNPTDVVISASGTYDSRIAANTDIVPALYWKPHGANGWTGVSLNTAVISNGAWSVSSVTVSGIAVSGSYDIKVEVADGFLGETLKTESFIHVLQPPAKFYRDTNDVQHFVVPLGTFMLEDTAGTKTALPDYVGDYVSDRLESVGLVVSTGDLYFSSSELSALSTAVGNITI